MVSKASAADIVCLALLAGLALPLRAVTLNEAQGEALLERAGQDYSRTGMASVQHVIDQHIASEPEVHARAAAAYQKFAKKLASSGCNYKGGLLPCPNHHICHYRGQSGVNTSASVEYRGNIIKTILHPDSQDEIDMPDLVTFMGAGTNDAPAMLLDTPEEYRRTADPVMLKMFFVEDTDNVTEECPHDSERAESMNDDTVRYSVDNTTNATFSVETRNSRSNMFMGMAFDFINESALGHTNAFMIPANTQIVWVTRDEMVQVLQSQELPASASVRLEAQLRKAKGLDMDDALTQKGSRRRRRRRRRQPSSCSSSSTGAMIGGAAAVGVAFLLCAFTFIGCFTAAPFLMMVGTTSVVNGACNCWGKSSTGETSCGLAR